MAATLSNLCIGGILLLVAVVVIGVLAWFKAYKETCEYRDQP